MSASASASGCLRRCCRGSEEERRGRISRSCSYLRCYAGGHGRRRGRSVRRRLRYGGRRVYAVGGGLLRRLHAPPLLAPHRRARRRHPPRLRLHVPLLLLLLLLPKRRRKEDGDDEAAPQPRVPCRRAGRGAGQARRQGAADDAQLQLRACQRGGLRRRHGHLRTRYRAAGAAGRAAAGSGLSACPQLQLSESGAGDSAGGRSKWRRNRRFRLLRWTSTSAKQRKQRF